jgi:glutaredoxin 3
MDAEIAPCRFLSVRLGAALGAIGAFEVAMDLRSEIAGRRRHGGVRPGCGWPQTPHIIVGFDREHQARDMTAGIEIYTRPGCGYCTAAKSLLTRKNAAFTELNVANDPAYREQMYDRAGHGTTFPQIFIGATHVGGCDELYALDRAGELDALLAGNEKATS